MTSIKKANAAAIDVRYIAVDAKGRSGSHQTRESEKTACTLARLIGGMNRVG